MNQLRTKHSILEVLLYVQLWSWGQVQGVQSVSSDLCWCSIHTQVEAVFACTLKPRIVSYCVVISNDFHHAPVRLLMRSIVSIRVAVCLSRSCSNVWKLWLRNLIFGVHSYILKISWLSSYARIVGSQEQRTRYIHIRGWSSFDWMISLVCLRWKLRHCVVWDGPFIFSLSFLFHF